MNTQNWRALGWGQELMQRDVSVLLCAGVDRFSCGALQGYGIEVFPNAVGSPDEALKQWRNGELTVPQMWSSRPQEGCGRALRRRKGHRGCW
ncbi:MAG: hypothetical protein E4H02_07920 [Lentisphaerales bacterium]|nr:MAG: hypothetical protein E4H02_07920 [Lentisphaerales bacterium]